MYCRTTKKMATAEPDTASEGGCRSWYAAVVPRLWWSEGTLFVAAGNDFELRADSSDPHRWAILQDHIRKEVAVRSMAGSVVLKDCTLS